MKLISVKKRSGVDPFHCCSTSAPDAGSWTDSSTAESVQPSTAPGAGGGTGRARRGHGGCRDLGANADDQLPYRSQSPDLLGKIKVNKSQLNRQQESADRRRFSVVSG